MAVRRITFMEDVDRLADAVWESSRGRITDFDSFDAVWGKYMDDPAGLQQSSLRLKVFDALRNDHPVVEMLGRKEFFELAGGKSLRSDRQRTARRVTTDREEFLRKGARHIDFQGLDTKDGRKVRLEFKIVGKVGGRVTHARRTKHGGKRGVVSVFRDDKGRFVSVKRRQ